MKTIDIVTKRGHLVSASFSSKMYILLLEYIDHANLNVMMVFG